MKKAVVFLILLSIISAVGSAKFHPQIKWQEIADEKFIVVFPAGYEDTAAYVLLAAGDIYHKLEQLWGNRLKKRIRILLSDRFDSANGSANFFPFNQVEIYLFNPAPESTLGSSRRWIDMVLAHELTHIFNMNAGSGFTYFMRKIVGSNPIFYPMSRAPVWLREGSAVYGESQIDAGGRLHTPDFGLMLAAIKTEREIPQPAHLYGDPTDWPGAEARYLYGARFIRFLEERYGEEKVKQIMRNYSYRFIPQLTQYRFKRVFGKKLSLLWREFRESIAVPHSSWHARLDILTQGGFIKRYPVFGPAGKVFYFQHNYQEFPGIYELDLKTGRSKRLLKISSVNGLSYAGEHEKIYFSASQYYKSFYHLSDLYEFDLKNSRLKRLTRGRRLFYPVRVGKKIYCVRRKGTKSFLAVFDLDVNSRDATYCVSTISNDFAAIAHISAAPDHSCIAASLKRRKGNWEIALFDLDGKLIRVLANNGKKNFCPRWKSAHELCFIAEEDGDYKLAVIDLLDDHSRIGEDGQMPAINHFDILPAHDRLLLSFFDANGYNLAAASLADLRFEDRHFISQTNETESAADPGAVEPRGYRFLRELAPKYFMPSIRDGGNELQPGLYLSGNDLLEKHAFELRAYWGFESKTMNFDFNYIYDGLYPTLVLNYNDYSHLYQSSEESEYVYRERKIRLAGLYPLSIRDRQQAYLYTNIHFERISERFEDAGQAEGFDLNGITLGFLYTSAQRYYDAISYADGMRLNVSFAREFSFMGSDYDINTLTFEYRQFLSLSRPNVLALRLAAAESWGEARRLFFMGGAESREGFFLPDYNLFDLMRGYPAGFYSGSGGFILNLEYRIALFKVERVVAVFRSIERFYLSLFADMGNLWLEEKTIDPSFSLGLELNLMAQIGDQKFNICGGVAIGRNPYRKPRFYFRLGSSF